jgi:hypothetical protein
MIEILNTGLGVFVIALMIYSFFTERPIIDKLFPWVASFFLTYKVGYYVGIESVYSAIIAFIVLALFLAIIIGKWKKASQEKEERIYSREELIIAKKIYDKNYLADPEGFDETRGSYEDAQVSIDYLLGIIDGQGKPFKKEWNESKVARS